MRIFITGANGQLAKSFLDLNQNLNAVIYQATKKDLDVTDKKQVIQQIKNFKPDIVFHFASLTRGDECVKHPEQAFKINVDGTKNIVEACNLVDAEILFVSTNEVFDGKKNTPYKENDKKNPITVVGKTKHEAEEIIKASMKKYYIVRTSWLFSKWSANFLHAVLKKAKDTKKVELVGDEISSPTYSYDLVMAIVALLRTGKYGIYHFSNEGFTSRLDFAKKMFEIYSIDKVEIIPIRLESYPRLSKPPLFSALKNVEGAKLKVVLPSWEDALKRFLQD